MPGMDDPKAKMRWAHDHLSKFRNELRTFLTSTPSKTHSITREDDVEHGWHIIRVRVNEVPTDVCLSLGDAVYNMRSALDQTVWHLAALKGPPGKTQFPIMEVWNADTRKRFGNQVFGVPDEAFCEIQSLQPYHRGDAFKSHPLWRLDEICNLDKHRRIPAYATMLTTVLTGVHERDLVKEATDDCHILRVPLSLKDKIQLNPQGTFSVSFGGDNGLTETADTIVEIHNFVARDVLPRFNRFFS
jgi:hypothetical protein